MVCFLMRAVTGAPLRGSWSDRSEQAGRRAVIFIEIFRKGLDTYDGL
jgi:hypothetical protein